jgi:predicted membrane-bound spermidine synthase
VVLVSVAVNVRKEPWGFPELVVFVAGISTLGAEIAAARLIAPAFGASTVVWANTIAIVLVALAGGYGVGGRLADRHPHARGLARMALLGAGLVALIPLLAIPLLDMTEDALGEFSGSLLVQIVLVAPPVLVLGALSPWAIRLRMRSVAAAGDVTGRLYALGTAGGLVGNFAATLALIPWLGTRWTFLVCALLLALISAPVAWSSRPA